MKRITLLVVDDHQMMRDGMKALLSDIPDMVILGMAENGKVALDMLAKEAVDLIILDINMPVMDGIETARQIRMKFPSVRILALTMLNEEEHIKKMIEAGASGYILKNSGKDELLNAIRTIMQGKFYFSDEATRAIMMDLVHRRGVDKQEKNVVQEVPLTDREREVLALIAKEFTNSEIADKLFISVRTVDAHRRNLFQKVGAKNTAGLVRFALERGLA